MFKEKEHFNLISYYKRMYGNFFTKKVWWQQSIPSASQNIQMGDFFFFFFWRKLICIGSGTFAAVFPKQQ